MKWWKKIKERMERNEKATMESLGIHSTGDALKSSFKGGFKVFELMCKFLFGG